MTQKLFTKNFVLLILGQLTSLFGNFILKLALSMYVLEVTGSAAIFAGILSIATIPTIVLSPLGGILADRADRRNIMVALDGLTGMSVLCAILLLSESNAHFRNRSGTSLEMQKRKDVSVVCNLSQGIKE